MILISEVIYDGNITGVILNISNPEATWEGNIPEVI